MKQELNLDEWLDSTRERLDQLYAYGKSPMPADSSERHAEINTLIQNEDDASRLMADAESFLSQVTAKAVLTMRNKYPDLSSKERDIMVRDSVRDVQRLVDGIGITVRTLASRRFLSMNANRSRA